MRNKGLVIVFGIIGLFSILTLKDNFKFNSTVPRFNSLAPFSQEGLQVSYKIFSSEDSQYYLDRDLLDYGFQPIHITIQNNTPNSFEIGPSSVNLPTASGQEVANKITKRSLPRAIAFRIASLFFWPLVIPSTIDSIKTYATHRSLKKDYTSKALKVEMIAPYSTIHRIVFIPLKDHNNYLTITLIDKDSGDKTSFYTS